MNEVKEPKKPIIFYYMIVMVVLLLFNALTMPWLLERKIQNVGYNTFLSMTEEKNIGYVEIDNQENTITFTDKNNEAIYKTAMVEDPDLTQRLYDAGASFAGTEMKQASPLLSIFMTWVLPLIIFIGIGQFMSKKMMERVGGKDSMMFGMGKSNAKVYREKEKHMEYIPLQQIK